MRSGGAFEHFHSRWHFWCCHRWNHLAGRDIHAPKARLLRMRDRTAAISQTGKFSAIHVGRPNLSTLRNRTERKRTEKGELTDGSRELKRLFPQYTEKSIAQGLILRFLTLTLSRGYVICRAFWLVSNQHNPSFKEDLRNVRSHQDGRQAI